MHINRAVIVLSGIIFLSACAAKVSVLHMVPAKYKIEDVRTIGILPLANSASENARGGQYITESLYKSLTWRKFFDDVRHVSSKDALNYHQIKDMSPDVAADLGRESNVDALVKGYVFAFHTNSELATKRVEREVGTGKYRTVTRIENGQPKTERVEIVKKVVDDVPTMKKKAEVGFALDVASVSKRKWTDHERFFKSKEVGAEGRDQIEGLPSNDGILDGLAGDLVTQAADSFVPHMVAEKRSLAKDKSCKDGIKLAKKGDWSGAMASWTDAAASDPQNHKVLYNLGVANEAAKNYKSAKDLYEKALALSDKKMYRDAVKNAQALIEDESRLLIQMKGRSIK